MVIERAELPIKEGREEAFAVAMVRGLALLTAAPGCLSGELSRGVEQPSQFLLLLRWTSVQAHIDFTKTAEFAELRGILGEFLAGAPNTGHFTPL